MQRGEKSNNAKAFVKFNGANKAYKSRLVDIKTCCPLTKENGTCFIKFDNRVQGY